MKFLVAKTTLDIGGLGKLVSVTLHISIFRNHRTFLPCFLRLTLDLTVLPRWVQFRYFPPTFSSLTSTTTSWKLGSHISAPECLQDFVGGKLPHTKSPVTSEARLLSGQTSYCHYQPADLKRKKKMNNFFLVFWNLHMMTLCIPSRTRLQGIYSKNFLRGNLNSNLILIIKKYATWKIQEISFFDT